ncbi:hemolysin activation protein, partial [Pseudomonas sp. HMWF031]
MVWITSGLFTAVFVWAFTAKVDQTISVRGRLQPTGSVQEVDSPSTGVVKKVFVSEGQLVQAGEPLLDVEAKGLASRREAIEQSQQILRLQARTLEAVIRSNGDI